jgi:hypothetical protein
LVFLQPKGKGSQFLEIGGNWSKGCCPVISGMNNRKASCKLMKVEEKLGYRYYPTSLVLYCRITSQNCSVESDVTCFLTGNFTFMCMSI